MPALADLFGLRNSTEASARSDVTCTEDKKLVKPVEISVFLSHSQAPPRYLINFGAENCFQHAIVFNTCSAARFVLCFYFLLALFNVSG